MMIAAFKGTQVLPFEVQPSSQIRRIVDRRPSTPGNEISRQAPEPGDRKGLVLFNPVAASVPDLWPAETPFDLCAQTAPSPQSLPIRSTPPCTK
jgi:hypothetical protein